MQNIDSNAKTIILQHIEKCDKNIIDYILLSTIEASIPQLLLLLRIMGLIEWNYTKREFDDSHLSGYVKKQIFYNKIKDLLFDPVKHFEENTLWGTQAYDPSNFFKLLLEFKRETDSIEYYEEDDLPVFKIGSLCIKKLNETIPGLNFIFNQFLESNINYRTKISDTFYFNFISTVVLNGESTINVKPPLDISLSNTNGQISGDLKMFLELHENSSPLNIISFSNDIFNLKVKNVFFGIDLSSKYNDELGFSVVVPTFFLNLRDLEYKVYSNKGDNIISKIIPESGLEGLFDLDIEWLDRLGLKVKGNVGFEINLIDHRKIGVIEISALILSIGIKNGDFDIGCSLNVGAELGPIKLLIEKIGIKSNIFLSDDLNKDLGFISTSLKFKPPSGISINIDTDAIKGGGYLYINTEEGRYAGVAGLSIKDKIKLSAFGLINTKFPDGRKGYSFLIFVSAEFSAIQLGFGFTLNGVGGLVGIHRSVNIDRLREGVKTKSYDRLLFPQNPVENALEIIADLEAIFPMSEDRYVFGIMGKIGWGSPTLITIDLGLIIEVPNPVKLAILGVVKAILPSEENAILKLQVNFLGVIDFGKKQLSFDATIYDSRLLTFSLAGDMALRLSWGENPNFLMSVGGFHPSYQPPPQLVSMSRLTLNLLGGDNPRLTLSCYFAVTSNTVQFGAKVDLFVKVVSKLTAEGYLGFDALFKFNPFYMKILAAAYLAIKWKGKEKFSILLSASLEGPTPWTVDGQAEVKVLCFKYTVNLKKTWGTNSTTTLPSITVKEKLMAALADYRNWSGPIQSGRYPLVILKEYDEDTFILSPESIIQVTQKVLPLNVGIELFGTQDVTDGGIFKIDVVSIGGENLTYTYIKEDFAPAQFRKMTEQQKLSSPSFQKYDAGIGLSEMEKLSGGKIMNKDVEYEVIIMEPSNPISTSKGKIFEEMVAFNALLKSGPASQSPLSQTKNETPLGSDKIKTKSEYYGVVDKSTMLLHVGSNIKPSYEEALDMMHQLTSSNVSLKSKLRVVPEFEIETV